MNPTSEKIKIGDGFLGIACKHVPRTVGKMEVELKEERMKSQLWKNMWLKECIQRMQVYLQDIPATTGSHPSEPK